MMNNFNIYHTNKIIQLQTSIVSTIYCIVYSIHCILILVRYRKHRQTISQFFPWKTLHILLDFIPESISSRIKNGRFNMVPDDTGSLHQHVGIDRMADVLLWCVVAVIEVTVVLLQKLLYRFLLCLEQVQVAVNLLIDLLVTRVFLPCPPGMLLLSL